MTKHHAVNRRTSRISLITSTLLAALLAGCAGTPSQYSAQRLPETSDYKSSDRVTVMLPSSGRFATAARVVRDGIQAASQASAAPKRPLLGFSDSADAAGIESIYDKAIAGGATYVIGPLEKPAVDTLLSKTSLAVPTLALNEAASGRRSDNLFQFSLSPENEATEVANKAAAMGAKRAFLLYPSNAWGERLANAFRRQWKNLGRSVVGQAQFAPALQSTQATPTDAIESSEPSPVPPSDKEIVGDLLLSGSADMMFLVATTEMAHRIYPIARAGTQATFPILSTSHVYSGSFKTGDQALSGLYFVDIPWMLQGGRSERLSRRSVPPTYSTGPLARLYAMGIDAYRLTPHLTDLAARPKAYFPGETGRLAIDPLGHITRQLDLGRFTDTGVVVVAAGKTGREPR